MNKVPEDNQSEHSGVMMRDALHTASTKRSQRSKSSMVSAFNSAPPLALASSLVDMIAALTSILHDAAFDKVVLLICCRVTPVWPPANKQNCWTASRVLRTPCLQKGNFESGCT